MSRTRIRTARARREKVQRRAGKQRGSGRNCAGRGFRGAVSGSSVLSVTAWFRQPRPIRSVFRLLQIPNNIELLIFVSTGRIKS